MEKKIDILVLDKLRKYIDVSRQNEIIKTEEPLLSKSYFDLTNYSTNIPNFADYFKSSGINAITLFQDLDYFNQNYLGNLNDNKSFSLINFIENTKPRIIFLKDYSVITENELKKIFKLNFKKKIFVSVGFTLPSKHFYKYFDKVYFRSPTVLNKQSKYAKSHELIYHSFNEKIISKMEMVNFNSKKYNFSFCGSIYSDIALHHLKRYNYCYNLLENNYQIRFHLNEKNSINHFIRFYNYKMYNLFGNKIKYLSLFLKFFGKIVKTIFKKKYKFFYKVASDIDNLIGRKNILYKGPMKKNFPRKIFNGLFGVDYYNLINQSKISLNIHTDIDKKLFGYNIRNFEITGCNSCLLVEDGNGLNNIFKKDDECVSYNNYEELKDKINYLSKNLNAAEKISKNGYKKTLNSHTHILRSTEFLEDFKKYL